MLPDVLETVARFRSVKVFSLPASVIAHSSFPNIFDCRLPHLQTSEGHGDGTPVSKRFDESANRLSFFLTRELNVSIGRQLPREIQRFVFGVVEVPALLRSPRARSCGRHEESQAECVAYRAI